MPTFKVVVRCRTRATPSSMRNRTFKVFCDDEQAARRRGAEAAALEGFDVAGVLEVRQDSARARAMFR